MLQHQRGFIFLGIAEVSERVFLFRQGMSGENW